jgi:predicted nuclease of predicted toxin-antitoxin system
MNLWRKWVAVSAAAGHECAHWSDIGAAKAADREIMAWARLNGSVVFTHDPDFGAILAATDEFPDQSRYERKNRPLRRIGVSTGRWVTCQI